VPCRRYSGKDLKIAISDRSASYTFSEREYYAKRNHVDWLDGLYSLCNVNALKLNGGWVY